MSRFTPVEKFEIAAIPGAVALTYFLTGERILRTELGYVIAGSALLLLLQGFCRDLWLLREARRAVAPAAGRSARCMCVESALGLSTILAGGALTLTGLSRPVELSGPVVVGLVAGGLIAGFLLKDFVFEWFPWKFYREKNHASVQFTWRK